MDCLVKVFYLSLVLQLRRAVSALYKNFIVEPQTKAPANLAAGSYCGQLQMSGEE